MKEIIVHREGEETNIHVNIKEEDEKNQSESFRDQLISRADDV